MATVEVTVSLKGGKISVDKNKVQASLSKGDRVQWTCSDGTFGIDFGGTWPNPPTSPGGPPFTAASGPFNKPAGTTLKYSVTASGLPRLDPDIDIVP
jgi:hypothetical protein